MKRKNYTGKCWNDLGVSNEIERLVFSLSIIILPTRTVFLVRKSNANWAPVGPNSYL